MPALNALWATDVRVLGERTAKFGEHELSLYVYECRDHPSGDVRTRVSLMGDMDGFGGSDVIPLRAGDLAAPRPLSKAQKLVAETAVNAAGFLFVLVCFTDRYGDGEDATVARRARVVQRSLDGSAERTMCEVGAGYVHQKPWVPGPPPPPPAPPAPEAPREPGFRCEECDHLTQDPVRVYECGTCGQPSDERRCETCNKFAAKLTDQGCDECFSADLRTATLARNPAGILTEIDENGAVVE